MRVLFVGYSGIGAAAVDLLVRRGDEIPTIITHRDDSEENRWYRTPAEAAEAHGLASRVRYSEDLDHDGLVRLARVAAPDLILSVFYRHLLPTAVLEQAWIAALNLHPSLLPAYRGRAPINWVLVNGESETGVTLHHMVRQADAGDIVGQRRIAIESRETALTLYRKIESEGIALLEELLPAIKAGTAPRIVQDLAGGSFFGRRRPTDGRIDWRWPVRRIDCMVRAVAPPWPGAFAEIAVPGVGRREIRIESGEPAFDIPLDETLPLPGMVRRDRKRDTIRVAAADGWFRIDDWSIIETDG